MKKFFIILLLVPFFLQVYSQMGRLDVIAPSGDFYSTAEISMSWTLGECLTETFVTDKNILTQGFQQDLFVITSLDEISIEGIPVNVYPNPASDWINILVESENSINKNVKVQLIDSQGKMLISDMFSINPVQLNMSALAQGFYLLRIEIGESKIVKSFKIQKVK